MSPLTLGVLSDTVPRSKPSRLIDTEIDADGRCYHSMKVIVPPDLDGERLDRAVAALLPEHSRSFVARLIDDGRVSLAGEPAKKSSVRVGAGDEIDVDVPPPAATEIVSQDLPLTVIHEDDDIVVIDKP